ncbi:MAG: DUF58 domain-containing protein [Gammaproteobacteria bacterium]|nr:DUF58 domain-containing protein [Gammaproteobacteria bacterium]
MLKAARAFLRHRAHDWARRRQGPDGEVVNLGRRRIYILPSRQGLLYGFTVFVMLLGSMNYSNSMGFMLSFVLAGLGLVAMHACHANLTGIVIAAGAAPPVFAGGTAHFHMHLSNPARTPRIAIVLSAEEGDTTVTGDIAAGEHGSVSVPLPAPRRGWLPLGRMVAETTYPFGLFRAWGWLHMPQKTLVYPAPAENVPPLPAPRGGYGRDRPTGRGEEDFSGLRDYRAGDSPRHIAWKSSARQQLLLTKQFAGTGEETCWLEWDSLPGVAPEERLSILCRWVLLAHAANMSYGLKIPGTVLPAGNSDAHRRRCLEALALFGAPAAGLHR